MSSNGEPQPSTSRENTEAANDADIEDMWNVLIDIFPDADPDFLFKIIEENQGNQERLQQVTSELLEKGDYPKLKDAIKRQNRELIKHKYMNRNVSIADFLEISEDPVDYFYNYNRPRSENYKEHVKIQLYNDFPHVQEKTIDNNMIKFNHNLSKCYRELQNNFCSKDSSHEAKNCKKKNKRVKYRYPKLLPEEPDELFYKELSFLQSEAIIREYIENQKKIQDAKIKAARLNGELMTCGCCFNDDCLIEEILLCDDGHMFCKECVRRSSEENIGQSKYKFPCLASDCKCDFPLSLLQQALKPAVFLNLIRRMQEAEIQEANIPDLISCPFCTFSAIVPNPDDKVFKCLNPDCKKESCRFCKEPNHVPLRCEEVERAAEVDMRTFIENKMTEALLRTCPKCKKNFVKEDGCNKMTCVCGAMMCYVCRKLIKGYDHYDNGTCPRFSSDKELHDEVVQKGGEDARKKFLADHPDLRDVKLKHDPIENLKTFQKGESNADYDSSVDDSSFGSSNDDFDGSDFESSYDNVGESDFESFDDDNLIVDMSSQFIDEDSFSNYDAHEDSEQHSVISLSDSEAENRNSLHEMMSSSSENWQASTETLSSASEDSSLFF